MAMIVTGMEMPNMCGRCDMWDISLEMCALLVQTNEDKMTVRKDCPLKSVEGLIEKINNLSDTIRGIRSDGNCFFTPEEVIKIIKEYCGLEENNGNQD